jgi:hypothetical protein
MQLNAKYLFDVDEVSANGSRARGGDADLVSNLNLPFD